MPRALAPLIAAALTLALGAPAGARPFTAPADDLTLAFGGALQPRVSYGRADHVMLTERFGFGLRRARVRASAAWQAVMLEFDVDLVGLAPFGLYLAIRPAENWTIRAGYFPGAQPRAMIPTGVPVIDGVERAAIAERWAGLTLGGRGRDVGIDVTWANAYVKASLWVHSGYGSRMARDGNNFWQSPSSHDATGGVDQMTPAISGALSFTPQDGLELGGFVGYNPTGVVPEGSPVDPDRSVTSWSAHAYWGPTPGSQFVRLKAEVIGLSIANHIPPGINGEAAPVDRDLIGGAGTAAVGIIPHGEVFGRFEVFDADDGAGAARYITAGVMFSPSHMKGGPFERERLTLAWAHSTRADDADHVVVLQGQWLF